MALIDYLSKEALAEAGTTLEELSAIRKDFEQKLANYEQAAQAVTNVLLKATGVHSGRYRVKNPHHLFKKIARKRYDNKQRVITVDNYEQEITDLAGVRVLHLSKNQWLRIHRFITETWTLHEAPTAYYREGDPAAILEMFAKHGCDVKQHPAGYRSVHYVVETSPTKAKCLVEIQVRTIFEEGWSEIDHKLRYPSLSDNPLIDRLLLILNRIAGSADEMSSFVQELHYHLQESKSDAKQAQYEHEEQVKQMQKVIDDLNVSAQDKTKLENAAKSLGEVPILHDFRKLFAYEAIGVPGMGSALSSLLGNKEVDKLGNKIADGMTTNYGLASIFQHVIDATKEVKKSPEGDAVAEAPE